MVNGMTLINAVHANMHAPAIATIESATQYLAITHAFSLLGLACTMAAHDMVSVSVKAEHGNPLPPCKWILSLQLAPC